MTKLDQRILPLNASRGEEHPTIHTPVPLSKVRDDPLDRSLEIPNISGRSRDSSFVDIAGRVRGSLNDLIAEHGPAVLGRRVMNLTDGILPFSMRHVVTRSVSGDIGRLRTDTADIRDCYDRYPAFRARLEEVRRTTDEEIAGNGMYAVAGALETIDALRDVPESWRTQVQIEQDVERIMTAGSSVYMNGSVREHGAGGDEIWMVLQSDGEGGFLIWDDDQLEGADFSGRGFHAFNERQFVPAIPGEMYYFPVGAIHAVTAGVSALVATAQPSVSSEIYSMHKIRGDYMVDGRHHKPEARALDHSHLFSAQLVPFAEVPDRHGDGPARIKHLSGNGVSMSSLTFPRGVSPLVRVETGGDVAAVTVISGQATIVADEGEVKHPHGGSSALVIPGTPIATSFGIMSVGTHPTSVLLTSMSPVNLSAAARWR